jgi:hypothetical protein
LSAPDGANGIPDSRYLRIFGPPKVPSFAPDYTAVEVAGLYPPPEVWLAVDAAAKRAGELEAEGREVDFRLDELTGHLSIELRDLAGTVFRELSVADAVAIAEGAPAR